MIYVVVGVIFFAIMFALFTKWARDYSRHERDALDKLRSMTESDDDSRGTGHPG